MFIVFYIIGAIVTLWYLVSDNKRIRKETIEKFIKKYPEVQDKKILESVESELFRNDKYMESGLIANSIMIWPAYLFVKLIMVFNHYLKNRRIDEIKKMKEKYKKENPEKFI